MTLMQLLNELNLTTVCLIFILFQYFKNRNDKKFSNLERKIDRILEEISNGR